MTTQIDVCNNALALIGQGSHISSLTENKKEADACKRLYDGVLRSCLESHNFSFAKKSATISQSIEDAEATAPFSKAFALPADCLRVIDVYEPTDGNFDVRVIGDQKALACNSDKASISYLANITDLSLMPAMFIKGVELALGASLAADLVKGVTGAQLSTTLLKNSTEILDGVFNLDAMQNPVIQYKGLSDGEVSICKNALNFIGQSASVKLNLSQANVFDACKRLLPDLIKKSLYKYDWTFGKKDEVITKDFLLPKVYSFPYKFTYKLPDDCARVNYVMPMSMTSRQMMVNTEDYKDYDYRNFNGQRVFVTDLEPSFGIEYQTDSVPLEMLSPAFIEAIEVLLAASLAAEFIPADDKTGANYQQSTNLRQLGYRLLKKAYEIDLPMAVVQHPDEIAGNMQDRTGNDFLDARLF